MLKNAKIRKALRINEVFVYELAEKMNVNESTIYRWLRYELPKAKESEMLHAIEEIRKVKTADGE